MCRVTADSCMCVYDETSNTDTSVGHLYGYQPSTFLHKYVHLVLLLTWAHIENLPRAFPRLAPVVFFLPLPCKRTVKHFRNIVQAQSILIKKSTLYWSLMYEGPSSSRFKLMDSAWSRAFRTHPANSCFICICSIDDAVFPDTFQLRSTSFLSLCWSYVHPDLRNFKRAAQSVDPSFSSNVLHL